MKVILASDHAGFELKQHLVSFLKEQDYDVEDFGPHEYDKLDDYPDFIIPAAEKVAQERCFGVVIGYSGQGEALAANKVKGIRAVIYNGGPEKIIELTKQHNNSNILSLGAHFVEPEQAKNLVKLWLETVFTDEERHVRRLNKISEYENK